LPAAAEKALGRLLDGKGAPEAAAEAVQKLLDAHCLVAVNVNPQSRVKVARGPAGADLRLGQEGLVLIKVHNEAGVTHALKVSGPQLRTAKGGWLEAAVGAAPPLGKTASRQKLADLLLRVESADAGQPQATPGFSGA